MKQCRENPWYSLQHPIKSSVVVDAVIRNVKIYFSEVQGFFNMNHHQQQCSSRKWLNGFI